MKRLSLALGAAALFATSLPTVAQQMQMPGQSQMPAQAGTMQRGMQGGMQGAAGEVQGPVVWVNTNLITGVVTEIHRGQRMLTARTDDGRIVTMAVGPDVHNFEQLQRGDQVAIRYTEAEAVALAKRTSPEQKLGEIRSTVESFAAAQAPQSADRPRFGAAERTTMVANVFDIDRQAGILTLRGTSGVPVEILTDPKALQQISKDDQVVISYIQATAVAIEPTNQRMAGQDTQGANRRSRDANR